VSGTTLTLDTTADAGTAATLVVNGTSDDVINNSEKTALASFTGCGSGLGCNDGGSAVVTFTSSGGGSVQEDTWPAATHRLQHTSTCRPLSDGTVTESMLITDAAGNTKTVTGTLVSGNHAEARHHGRRRHGSHAGSERPSDDVINNSEKTAVAFTVAGLDSDVTTGGSAGRDLYEQRRRVGAEDPGPAANTGYTHDRPVDPVGRNGHGVDADHRCGGQHQDGHRHAGERHHADARQPRPTPARPATLVVNGTSDDVINNSEKTAVAFTVAGLDSDVTTGGSAVVTFTSSGGGSVQKTPGQRQHRLHDRPVDPVGRNGHGVDADHPMRRATPRRSPARW